MDSNMINYVIKNHLKLSELSNFANDQIAFDKKIVKAINKDRKSVLLLSFSLCVLWFSHFDAEKRIKKLEKEIQNLKDKTQEDTAFDIPLNADIDL